MSESLSATASPLKQIKARLRPLWRKPKAVLRLMRSAAHDYLVFRRHSGAVNKADLQVQSAQIVKYYHMIEKGLALPEPQPGFGHDPVNGLSIMVTKRLRAGDTSPHIVEALEALAAYQAFNERVGGETPRCVGETLALAASTLPRSEAAAIKQIKRSALLQAINFDAEAFFGSRFSVRQFAATPIDPGKIQFAARMAQTAPSACNRQAGRVHIVNDPKMRNRYLQFQNGNRGFGDTMGALAVITVDLRAFVEPEERFQGWVDGGLFAMAFILGLHARGLGTCCLNWSAPASKDVAFHRMSKIPEYESIIMFLAIGELREEFQVARSPRKPLSEILKFIEE